jgi:hypothetical protein
MGRIENNKAKASKATSTFLEERANGPRRESNAGDDDDLRA